MAYNMGFPIGYQPYYPQYQYQTTQAPQAQQTGGKIWVSGETGAKAYVLAPNASVELWDSEQQTIYLKSADASGIPSMKILDYVIRSEVPAKSSDNTNGRTSTVVSVDDLNSLQGQIDALKDEIRACKKMIEESEVYYEQSNLRGGHEKRIATESNADAPKP